MKKLEVIDDLGYLWEDCIEAIGENRRKEFEDFMMGQTMAISPTKGESLVYPWDFDKFIRGPSKWDALIWD